MNTKYIIEEIKALRCNGKYEDAVAIGKTFLSNHDLFACSGDSEDEVIVQSVALETAFSQSMNNEFEQTKGVFDFLIHECNNVFAANVLAQIYKKQGKSSEALTQMKANLEQFPDDIYALNSLGGLYKDMGKTDKALETFSAALEKYPDDKVANRAVSIMHKENKNYDLAKIHCAKALDADRDNTGNYILMGQICLNMSETEEAKENFKSVELRSSVNNNNQQKSVSRYFLLVIAGIENNKDDANKYALKIIQSGSAENNNVALIKTLCERNLVKEGLYDDICAVHGRNIRNYNKLQLNRNTDSQGMDFQSHFSSNSIAMAKSINSKKINHTKSPKL